MEKIKFTVQILVLVLALPVLFFAEMTTDKAVPNVDVNNSDSIQVKKATIIKGEKAVEDLDLKTASFNKLMPFCN